MKLISGLAAVALAATTLAQPAAAATDAPAPAAARAGTAWLATQLTDGVIHNDTYDFDDLGMTMDIGLSMDEVGGDQALVRQIRSSLSTRVGEYVTGGSYGDPSFRLAGELAKSLVFAQASGADPRTYGGYDLPTELEQTVTASGPSAGRVVNHSPAPGWDDYANSFSQALAVRGLAVAGSGKAAAATDFLLLQQCSSGYFRTFFTADPTAANQSCVDGTDPTDTDTTAFVVSQLSAVPSRSTEVDSAIARAVAWLTSTQRADGSFIGSTFTPEPNSNSTGLAASALAAAGRCELAGTAAEWVGAHQVGTQQAGSPLAGDEGAIAYSDATFEQARTAGITADDRPTWWRTSVQAVAGLTHARGSVAGLKVASAGTEPAATVRLTVTGAQVGDRYCLAGPGITGSRTAVVGTEGTLTPAVTLPAASGPATYTLTGRDGTTSHTIAVTSPTSRGSISGVRLSGPAGFRPAGSKAVLEVVGATSGARYQLRGPGLDVTVVAGSDGELTRSVRLPDATTTASYVLFGEDGQVADDTRVLGRKKLKVSSLASDGPRTRVLVRKLVAREKVKLVVGGKVLAKGRANAKGRFVTRVALPKGKAKVRVRAVGQFPALRSGATVVELR